MYLKQLKNKTMLNVRNSENEDNTENNIRIYVKSYRNKT